MFRFLIPVLFLYLFGLFNLLGIKPTLVQNHIMFIGIAFALYIAIKHIGITFFKQNALFFFLMFIVLLIATIFFGLEINGSKSWLNLYFFHFQVSELFKVSFILFLAAFLTQNKRFLTNPLFYIILLGLFIIPTSIIFFQPDLGSSVIIACIFFIMIFFSGIPHKYIAVTFLLIFLSLPMSWFFLQDYQKDRITSFISPSETSQSSSYNMTQSIITVGSGQFMGRGLGLGKQTTLFFLPENHTDFAFSSLVEQFGFVGGIIVIGLYTAFAFVLARKIIQYYNVPGDEAKFKFLYSLGFFSFLIIQIFINIGMNMGIMPITGITLPLISYGGSSLVTFMVGMAFLR